MNDTELGDTVHLNKRGQTGPHCVEGDERLEKIVMTDEQPGCKMVSDQNQTTHVKNKDKPAMEQDRRYRRRQRRKRRERIRRGEIQAGRFVPFNG